ncbi:hypothetical protein ACHAQJ_006551 [Trichoderma viride]
MASTKRPYEPGAPDESRQNNPIITSLSKSFPYLLDASQPPTISPPGDFQSQLPDLYIPSQSTSSEILHQQREPQKPYINLLNINDKLIPVPIDYSQGSSKQDKRRQRNAQASIRSRIKRKLKEQHLEEERQQLLQQLEDLKEERQQLLQQLEDLKEERQQLLQQLEDLEEERLQILQQQLKDHKEEQLHILQQLKERAAYRDRDGYNWLRDIEHCDEPYTR